MALSRVLTLLVVVDEADADDGDRRRQRRPAASTRAGSSSSSRATSAARPGSTPRSGSAATPARREVVVLRLYGQLASHGRAVRHPAAARRLPHRRVVAHARPAEAVGRPDRRDGAAPGHRCRAVEPGAAHGAAPARRGLHRRRHRPGVVADHPVARPARRGAGPAALRAGHAAPPSSRPPTPRRATCSPAGWPCGCAARSRSRAPATAAASSRCGSSGPAAPSTWCARSTATPPRCPSRASRCARLALAHRGGRRVPRRRAAPARPRRGLRGRPGDRSAQVHRVAPDGHRGDPRRQGALGRRGRAHRGPAAPGGPGQRQQPDGRGAADARQGRRPGRGEEGRGHAAAPRSKERRS